MCPGDSPPLLPCKRKLDDLPALPHPSSRMLQFFVRVGARSRVFLARPDETVEDLHTRIRDATGIPTFEQRLIYAGRQLQRDLTLAQCGVSNDSCLHLSGRLRSMQYPRAWTLANDVVSWVTSARECRASRFDHMLPSALVRAFLSSASACADPVVGHFLQVFVHAGASAALVMLYLSQPSERRLYCKTYAEKCILLFVHPDTEYGIDRHCGPVLLDFCRLFRGRVSREDPLYIACRRKLGALLEPSGFLQDSMYSDHRRSIWVIRDMLPFVLELGFILNEKLLKCLAEQLSLTSMVPVCEILREFSNFIIPLERAMEFSIKDCETNGACAFGTDSTWVVSTQNMYSQLLGSIDRCLEMLGEILIKEAGELSECQSVAWTPFLLVLTELNRISNLKILKVRENPQEMLRLVLFKRSVPLNALLSLTKRNITLQWFLELDGVTNFEARRNLVMMLFPEEKEDYGELHEMLIDRSNVLAESFEYIMNAKPISLQNNIFMEFKHEEATGPGVLREWFYLLSRAIFNPQNVLFLSCPNDLRRFYPNPASAVDPLHLKYFNFCGRIVALALKLKVPIGVVFDRVFFQQLAGRRLSLEDIQAADPMFFTSCKKILEMEDEILDSDVLGLTFETEMEVLGARQLVELCPGGKEIVVTSTNRQEYVECLIHHRFVASISKQVSCFTQGFADIISSENYKCLFFKSLQLEDFDRMLGGREGGICVEDWKTHTEYKGFTKKDKHIKWFWKVVQELSLEQRKVLLTFWTSLRHLPSDGFEGLPSKLYIHKSLSSSDSLPTSHTCFYQLCLPAYPLLRIMRERLQLVTQEHVGSSFGKW